MSPAAAGAHAPGEPTSQPERQPSQDTSWPQDVSHHPTMTIGAALKQLQAEFPAVTMSKLRFFEKEGLVVPSRTGSGYRMYSKADVERLRYVLTAQRDAYLPLRVIREQLDDLDAGRPVDPPPAVAQLVARDGDVVQPARSRLTARELGDATGASLQEIEAMAAAGVIRPDRRGRYESRAVRIVVLAATLGKAGIDPRHLRLVRQAAQREADTVARATAAERTARHSADRERARARALELAELMGQLHAELLRAEMD